MKHIIVDTICLLICISGFAESGNPNWSSTGIIAYTSSGASGQTKIFLVNPDGTDRRELTDSTSPYKEEWPVFSPDGNTIAFVSDRESTSDIYIANIKTKAIKRITQSNAYGGLVSWSPDGKKLAYYDRVEGTFQIFVVELSSGAITQLTHSPGHCTTPDWSKDGKSILYAETFPDKQSDIMRMNADGLNAQHVTSTPLKEGVPKWSPDGSKIGFEGQPAAGEHFMLFVMNPDGSNRRQITESEGHNVLTTWSPDGKRIAHESTRTGNWEVFITTIADGTAFQLTHTEVTNLKP